MVKCMDFFSVKNLIRVVAVAAVCMISCGAHATYYDDDDYDECPYFTPAYALCTTHAYNADMATNPSDSSQIAHMNEIIALKSTVIAQQMKQQYDVLNAMVKRFKTQLEKSVLKSKIEVMTGGSSSSSSSSGGASNNGGLAAAEDCDTVGQRNVYDCLTRNLSKINQAVEKDLSNARKQLVIDYNIAKDYKVCGEGAAVVSTKCNKCEDNFSEDTRANKNDVKNCISQLRRQIDQARTEYERENARSRYDDRR